MQRRVGRLPAIVCFNGHCSLCLGQPHVWEWEAAGYLQRDTLQQRQTLVSLIAVGPNRIGISPLVHMQVMTEGNDRGDNAAIHNFHNTERRNGQSGNHRAGKMSRCRTTWCGSGKWEMLAFVTRLSLLIRSSV